MFELSGRRVVITGAAGGVGQALVSRFKSLGASVVVCDLPEAASRLDDSLEQHCFDMQDSEAVVAAARDIAAAGSPYCVISNAGWTRAETFAELDMASLSQELDLNFRGAAQFTGSLLPAMRGRDEGGNFLFIASVNALMHYGNPAYAAAKAALLAWSRAIATEEGRHGLRANVIAPGSIRTPAWDHRIADDPSVLERVSQLYPLGRMVEPEEVANTAAFLCSPLASGITGTVLPVDAGLGAGSLPFIDAIKA
ncbi:SDR family oxidoreductase [Granulosicoccus sp. 3-233]|uniref:SDR family oxidoreductase n=1 Tax=Granulosicoccus sp. 3-233 TaxID=3417969 RepID=UPI003D3420B6